MLFDQKHLFWGGKNLTTGKKSPTPSPPRPLMANVLKFFHFLWTLIQVQTLGTCGGLFSQIFLQPSFSTKLTEKIFFVESSTKVTRKRFKCEVFVNLLRVEFETSSSWRLISSRVCVVCGAQLCTTT